MKVSSDLIARCKKGDRRAQNRLYELCYGVLMSICLRYERNHEDARYLLNIGFMKIATNLDKYPKETPFEHWARRIMINTNIDEYRRNKKRKENISYQDFEEGTKAWNDYHLEDVYDKFNAEELENMIRSLKGETQKVFNLYAIDGYSHKEIADMLVIPVGTSKWHLSKARSELKAKIEMKLNKPKAPVS